MDNSILNFYKGKRVFITGCTGFKGSWLCRILLNAGAEVTGFALEPPTEPNLFTLAEIQGVMHSVTGDVRNFDSLYSAFSAAKPEIVFHLAAQPIVRESYRNPCYTYETNVMGTVHIMECLRRTDGPRSFLNVTTDKVYKNNEWIWGYREDEPLDGYDPYSNSKSCSELVTHTYRRSFFAGQDGPAISTVRAGNVIGGGDFSTDRIIPDCIRAVKTGRPLKIRNPNSIRPYQHVLEPLFAYLLVAMRQYEDKAYAGSYNVGPNEDGCISTGELVELFDKIWGDGFMWENKSDPAAPHEDNFLKLDCTKLKNVFGWKPRWHIREAIQKTVDWTRAWISGEEISLEMDREIQAYLS